MSGKFSPAQKVLYDIVLDVQSELIKVLESQETVSVDGLYAKMQAFLSRNLESAGLIRDKGDRLGVHRFVNQLCPHHVSHYLGMDVHDTAYVAKSVDLKPNMVITVEPGIYVPQTMEEMPKEFRGIGIRIEDDVLITSSGAEVLSAACPKTVSEIEELCAKS